jgi:ubiquinone/menaquinone biosynthesis C-methylase UbiE
MNSLAGENINNDKNRVCPVELADSLDSRIRRLLQNPERIISPYIKEGMTVLDFGCGPGFFSIEIAKLIGRTGRLISADLQEGMLRKLRAKIKGTELESRIKLVKSDKSGINVRDKVDFILVFYVVHEVPDKIRLFEEFKTVLKEKGMILLVEPKFFHVSKSEFAATTGIAEKTGFKILKGPALAFSWSAVLELQ